MKSQSIKKILAALILLLSPLTMLAEEAYAVYTESNTTLTFYYDNLRNTRPGTKYDLNSLNYPGWWRDDNYANVTNVVFDSSFRDARPTSTWCWFYDMTNLASIQGMKEYLNTSEVTDMRAMFEDCSSLTSLDVSGFNTENVTTMYCMFAGCSSLTSLDVSGFKTDNVMDMMDMFYKCSKIENLDVSGFNTAKVKFMVEMFHSCESLTSLDVSGFNTATVTDMDGMFGYCSGLTNIYCNDNWNKSGLSSTDMFKSCLNLKGGNGTVYNSSYTDATYAHPDAAGNPGYFTQPPYAALDGTTLTFYCDGKRSTRTTTFDLNSGYNFPGWYSPTSSITQVTFDASFQNARPTSTCSWFNGMKNLTSITGMKEYLNTSEVKIMSWMFDDCSGLTSLDVSAFNTAKVTSMYSMFYGCSSLTSLDVSGFNTAKVTSMDGMFSYCSNLKTIYCNDNWNKSGLSSTDMFKSCLKLNGGKGTTYSSSHTDATYAHPDAAGNPGYFTQPPYAALDGTTLTFYFDGKRSTRTTTYDLNSGTNDPGWYTDGKYARVTKVVFDYSFMYARPTSTYHWFYGMRNLTSIQGMKLYLNTSEVTTMYGMFYNCSSLTSLDVSGFNTENVTDMSWMFRSCSSLTSLDVRNFKTTAVQYMDYMFYGCSSLETIYCNDDWNESNPTSARMFTRCESLKGGNGTAYNGNYTTATYAHPDVAGNRGYFSAMEAYAALSTDSKTLTFYYDGQRISRTGTTYLIPWTSDYPGWTSNTGNSTITTVNFDPSFDHYHGLTTTYDMFYGLRALTTINNLKYLHTENVTDMRRMFQNCSSLTSLDVSGFNTEKVTYMMYMFSDCSSLTTIYCDKNWDRIWGLYSTGMFFGCESLVGGKGTVYNYENTYADYAHPDGGTENPGYFSMSYAVLSTDGTTLTFYYDGQRNTREGTTYYLNTGATTPGWNTTTQRPYITTVVFDASFQYARPTSTYWWFYLMTALNSITGMKENLNTSQVTNMNGMFGYCSGLTSLDLSGFNTENVTTMSGMFASCSNLTSLDVSSFNTENVTAMNSMFGSCSKLTSLDVSSFNTENVTNMSSMFYNCSSLETICCNDDWNESNPTSTRMFFGCSSLVGGKGTAYNSSYITATYAHPDGGTDNQGYFSAKEAYAVLSTDNKTLTFYYDGQRNKREGTTYDLNGASSNPAWYSKRSYITTVVFDASFQYARPTSTYSWFYGMGNLTSITGMKENLNTSQVTTMRQMFRGCSSLTSLDVSGFNTENVTTMYGMFYNCSSLTSLDVSGFNTENVTDMSWMFRGCSSLTSLDVSGFNTANVTVMNVMFQSCSSLTSLDVSGFNTAKVTGMQNMFYSCSSLTSLDVSGFNTAKVTNMDGMFGYCSGLTNIYCDKDWLKAGCNSLGMFRECTSLVGGNGTTYSESHIDATYAHLDAAGNPGYFSVKEPYAVLDGTTLTFYYDGQRISRTGTKYLIPWTFDYPGWTSNSGNSTITTISFDPSFDHYHGLTTTKNMFYLLRNLTTINNLEYLHTENVTDMSMMFNNCYNLTSLDVSGFNTEKVTTMTWMFRYCSALTTIYCDNDWKNVNTSTGMFSGCESLVGGKGTVYNYQNTYADYAHPDGGTENPGYFTSKFLLGDANGDGKVTITDAVAVVNYIIHGATPGTFNVAAADVDGNGEITIADAVGIANLILNSSVMP